MSSRVQEKAARRAAREEERRQEAVRARSRRLWQLGATVALAVVLVAGAVLLSQTGSEDEARAGADPAALLRGIPQDGIALGDPDAPVTMVEFVDLQCPFCAQFSAAVLPTLIEERVRTGQLRIELRMLAFLGPDSVEAARAVNVAALEDRAWSMAEVLFARQGPENSDWVTDDLVRSLAADIPGLQPEALLAARDDPRVGELLTEAERLAVQAGIASTPSFLVGPTGGELDRLEVTALAPAPFLEAVDAEMPR